MVHYLEPFSSEETDIRIKKMNVIERLEVLENKLAEQAGEIEKLRQERDELKEEMLTVRGESAKANACAEEALKAHDRISNGEIINAAFSLLGYTSTSKSSRPEFYRKLWRNFPLVFEWAKRRNAKLTEEVFKEMIQIINPAHENPWISLRNMAAHRITVAEAKASASRQGKDGILLRKWIELLTVDETDAMKSLDQIAFRGQLLLPSEEQSKPMTDLASFVKLLQVSPREDLEEFGEVVQKLCQKVVEKTEVPNQHDIDVEFED